MSFLVQRLQLGQGSALHVVLEVGEHGRADSPGAPSLCLGLLHGLLGLICVDHLVHTSQDIASSDVLEKLSCLEEEAPVWDFDLQLLVVSQPGVEAWESRFSVDGQESNVVVEPSENGADIVFHKV